MGRLATLRALGLLLVALALMAAMVALGLWQFSVYDDHQQADAMATMRREPIPLERALGPDQAFPSESVGVPVWVEGHYDATGQLYVYGFDGAKDAYAVVTPLVDASGSAVLVVRGSSPRPQAPVPDGAVQVRGVLEPSQTTSTPMGERRVTDTISIAGLVGGLKQDLYAGYLVMTTSDPPDRLSKVDPPVPNASRRAGVRNLLYALQWWVFAAFVGFMWWQMVIHADAGTDADIDVDPVTDPERGSRVDAENVG